MTGMKVAILLSILAVSGCALAQTATGKPPSNETSTTAPETITPTSPSGEGTTTPANTTDTTTPPATTGATTTPVPLTTVAPSVATNTYKVMDKKNVTCLMVKMATQFVVNDKDVVVDSDAKLVASDSNCSEVRVMFGGGNWFMLLFKNESKDFVLDTVEAQIGDVHAKIVNQTIGKTTLGASYYCAAGITVKVNQNVTMNATSVQFQPFEVKDGKFGTVSADMPDPTVASWTGRNENDVCFLAMMGIQFRATFNTTAKVTKEAYFNFNGTIAPSSENCTDVSSFSVTWTQPDVELMITWSKDKTDFYMSNVSLVYNVTKAMFPNATEKGPVKASADGLMLMGTKVGSSYSCMMESQVALTSTGMTSVYLRLVNVSGLQPFMMNKTKPGAEAKCYSDNAAKTPVKGKWLVNDDKTKKTCIRVESAITLRMSYHDVMGKVIDVSIPVNGSSAKMTGSCADKSLTLDLDGDKAVTLTLQFAKDNTSYALDGVKLEYDNSAKYFQNHAGYGAKSKISAAKLNAYATSLGNSYRCDLEQMLNVANLSQSADSLDMNFNTIHFEAFKSDGNGTFSKAQLCAQEQTTAIPISSPTTSPPYIPATDPNVENFTINDSSNKNKTCFMGQIGLQMRLKYEMKNKTMAEASFNFPKLNSTVTATCKNNNQTVVTFVKGKVSVALTFTGVAKSNQAYLSSVTTNYHTSALPDAMNATLSITDTTSDLMLLQSMMNESYSCMARETDVLLNSTTMVVVRITGVKTQSFNIKSKKFSKSASCFYDKPTPKAYTGNWSVTDKAKHECARYMFNLYANITYPTLIGTMEHAVFPLTNDSKAGFGVCGLEASLLWVNMTQANFTFTFNKTDATSKATYHMKGVFITYDPTDTTYFPNHQFVADKSVQVFNNSLHLFDTHSGHSYKCTANTTANLNMTVVTFADVHIQPFGIEESKGFSAAEDCAGSKNSNKWGAGKIAVVCVIGVVALAVVGGLIFYCVRKRKAKSAYQQM